MKMIATGRGRGRPRGKAAQERQGTQDYPCTPPVQSRYATRSSRANIAPQLLPMPPSGGKPCLRPALRILKEGEGTSEPRLQHCSSEPPIGDGPVFDKSLEDEKSSSPNVSPTIYGPHSNHVMDLDALCAKITSQAEGPEEVALQQESHQDVDEDLQPPRDIYVALRDEPVRAETTTTDAPPTNQSLSRCHSLNMTEFAKGLKNELDNDHDEVVSAPRLGYEFVHGHEVKTEIAGLLRAIYEKHGDITRECKVDSPSIFSFLLERMCDVYHTLKSKNLYDLTLVDIKIMRDELRLCEDHKLNVGWLVQRLDEISETTNSSQEYLMLKREAEKCMALKRKFDIDLVQHQKHVAMIQKEIATLEQKIMEKDAKANKFTQKAIEIRTRAKALGSQSLVHGLL